MRPQFPGMDPWLEQPTLWPNVHSSLITSIRDVLAPVLAPRYFIDVETRTTVLSAIDVDRIYQPDLTIHAVKRTSGTGVSSAGLLAAPVVTPIRIVIPDDEEVEETFLEIRELPGRKLISVIEVLSPTNKKASDGRREYLDKRKRWIKSRISLVEIDLLRSGAPMPVKDPPEADYRIVICRDGRRGDAELFAFSYKSPIPPIKIPLVPGDSEPILELSAVLHSLYERARYDLVIDYQKPPQPSLRAEDEPWAAAIIAEFSAQRSNPATGNGNGIEI
jgi:hypothetical protein